MLANLKIICQFHAHPVHQNRGEIFCAKIYWGGLAPYNLIQPTISLEMPVPSQGHYGFHGFPVVD
jgi:hypothetical protein